MSPPRIVSSLVLAVLLLASSALAAWGIEGAVEPDTPQDREGWAFTDPETDDPAVRKVYFNALVAQSTTGHIPTYGRAGVNPNMLEGSRLAPVGSLDARAYLGIWKDCNRDGYVGMAHTALWEYREELLSDKSLCPDGSQHRRVGWVQEFVWISPSLELNPNEQLRREFFVYDPVATVWGDMGLPGHVEPAACLLTKAPRGFAVRTGGIIGVADCQVGHAITGMLATADSQAQLGLAFEDPRHPETDCDNVLNQRLTLYHDPYCPGPKGIMEPGPEPTVHAIDCDTSPSQAIRDPTASPGERGTLSSVEHPFLAGTPAGPRTYLAHADGAYAYVPRVAPSVNTQGALVQSYADVHTDIYPCTVPASPVGIVWWLPFYPTRPASLQIGDPAAYGDPVAYPSADAPKRHTEFPMGFARATTARSTQTNEQRVTDAAGVSDRTGNRTGSFGIFLAQQANNYGWSNADVPHLAPRYDSGLVRSDGTLAGPTHVTFYARVGTETLKLAAVPGGEVAGTYGSEACGIATTGTLNGWDCDGTTWWKPENGAPSPPLYMNVARAGDPFHLRDVDCLDGTLAGVRLQPSSLADTPGCETT